MKDLEKKELEKKIELAALRHWSDGLDMETGEDHGSESSFIAGALSLEAKEYWQQELWTTEEVAKLLDITIKMACEDKRNGERN